MFYDKKNMKKKIKAIIFDLDGTLYTFDKGEAQFFTASKFGQQIQNNCVTFFKLTFNLTETEALAQYQDIKVRYKGEISLGLEKEFNISRSIYFAQTWNIDPQEFMEVNQALISQLSSLKAKTGILSAAPRVWVEKVLKFLDINRFFEPAIFTGDPDIRKPNPEAFRQLAEHWNLPASAILAIRDQEETDILPAKSLGMLTGKVGTQNPTSADFVAPTVIELLITLREKKVL